jgi:hypothetical protein
MKMHKNPVWLAFLFLILLGTLSYTGKAFYHAYTYLKLSSETDAVTTSWSVQSDVEGDYTPYAHYTYVVKGTPYQGNTLFTENGTANPLAAEDVIKELAATPHKVYYQPSDPSYSSLHKKFPLKECISAGVLWALALYFFWLGVYVANLTSNGRDGQNHSKK